MKRKIIKLGQATFVLSLPSKWVRQCELSQGDYLEVEEKGGRSLTISTEAISSSKETTIDIKKLNTRIVSAYLQSLYVTGFDRITLLHNTTIDKYKTKKKVSTSQFIQDFVTSRFIGLEIVEQSETKTVLSELTAITEEKNLQVFSRIVFLLRTLSEDCVKALEENDKEIFATIPARRDNVARFLLYYQRIQTKTKQEDAVKSSFIAQRIAHLNYCASVYKHFASVYEKLKPNFSKEIIIVFRKVSDYLKDTLTLILKFDDKKIQSLIQEREEIQGMLKDKLASWNREDMVLDGEIGKLMFVAYALINDSFTLHKLEEK